MADLLEKRNEAGVLHCTWCKYCWKVGFKRGSVQNYAHASGFCHLNPPAPGPKGYPWVNALDGCEHGVEVGTMSPIERIANALESLDAWHREPSK